MTITTLFHLRLPFLIGLIAVVLFLVWGFLRRSD
jgi:hypothetical protein